MKAANLRGYLLTGLVVWLPILATFVVIRFLVDMLDKTLSLLPYKFQPEQLFGMHMPGFGVILSLIILLITGIVATNFFGQKIMLWSESLLVRIPLVRTIYNGTKQIITTVISKDSKSFKKVLLVEWPRKGIWSIAFHTGAVGSKFFGTDQKILPIEEMEETDEMISIFIPTTPNPIGGFVMILPQSQTIELNMSIDEALKYIISLGVMHPESVKHKHSSKVK